MEMLQYIRRLFAYDDWANREVLARLQAVAVKSGGEPPPRSLQLLGHIIGAEWLWMERMQKDLLPKERKNMEVWPELSLNQCAVQIADLRRRWPKYMAELTEEDLGDFIAYKNTKGETWSNTIDDILMHVVMHSSYHRAQIAADLRAAGHEPAMTDFIHAVRLGYVK